MPGRVLMRRGVVLGLLAAVAVLLVRRVGVSVHHFPPLAAFNPAASFPLEPAAVLVEFAMRRCRAVLPIVAVVALVAEGPVVPASRPDRRCPAPRLRGLA